MSRTERKRKPQLLDMEQTKRSTRLSNLVGILILLIIIFITVLATRFFEKLHYDNLLQQQYSLETKLQTGQNATKHDLKYLIKNFNAPLECYQMESTYAQSECQTLGR